MSFIVSLEEEKEQDEVVRSISKNKYTFRNLFNFI